MTIFIAIGSRFRDYLSVSTAMLGIFMPKTAITTGMLAIFTAYPEIYIGKPIIFTDVITEPLHSAI